MRLAGPGSLVALVIFLGAGPPALTKEEMTTVHPEDNGAVLEKLDRFLAAMAARYDGIAPIDEKPACPITKAALKATTA